MDIPEIVKLPAAIEMRREVLKLALEKNLPEEEIWDEIEIYKKTHFIIKRDPRHIGFCLDSLLNELNIVKSESPMEDLFKSELKQNNINFERQKEIGRFKVDFFFSGADLIVEIDGEKYHSSPEQREKDRKRDSILMKKGYAVLRFAGHRIYRDVGGCVKEISKFLGKR